MTISRLFPAALVATFLSSSAFGDGSSLVKFDLVRLDPEVAHAQVEGIANALSQQLAPSFSFVSESEVEGLRVGAEKPVDVSAALGVLADARNAMNNFDNKSAQKKLKEARALLEPMRPSLRNYDPLTNLWLYTAVVAMNKNDKKGAQAAFTELARLRPDYHIDAAQFPPNVLEAFEKARAAEAKQPRGRMVLSSSPAGAKLYVDEVASGQTPVTVAASPGEHVIRFELTGYNGTSEKVKVESYEKIDKQATLEKNPNMAALRQLEAEVQTGGSPSALPALGAKVAEALKADGVLVGLVALSVDGTLVSVAYLPR